MTFADEVRDWAAPTFADDRPVVEVLVELAHRIRTELAYRSGSTTVHTTQAQLLAQKAGVCQDFAHLMISALRLHGLPRGTPAATSRRGRRRPAEVAWCRRVARVGVRVGARRRLVEVDPTNDQLVDDRYVLLGWGRDYDDVPPLRGVIFTEGSGSRLTVSVDLVPSGQRAVRVAAPRGDPCCSLAGRGDDEPAAVHDGPADRPPQGGGDACDRRAPASAR